MKQFSYYGENHAAVTPSDTTQFNPSIIHVTVTGNVVAEDAHGNAVTYNALPVGFELKVLCTRIKAATTATVVRIW